MKVGDLIRIMKDNWVATSEYKGYQGQLAIIVDGVGGWNETKVKMVSDGAELWFLTKELEDVK